jgi:NAD+ diphosphatase
MVDGSAPNRSWPATAPATIAFAGATVDRAAHLRDDSRRLRELDTSRVLLVGTDQRIALGADDALTRLGVGALPAGTPLTFLGLEPSGAAVFAADALDLHASAALDVHSTDAPAFTALRELMAELEPAEAALAAYAVGMVGWHRVQRHCGRCGHATEIESGGHRRRCPHCGLLHFPRTDPAVTMLVQDHDEDRCLLSRRHGAPEHRWSALAGFVEPGETLEEAVRREAREETGIVVTAVEFVAAQPWPFPAALMIGFWAQVDPTKNGTPEPQAGELVAPRWWGRAELATALAEERIAIPPLGTIGNYLISRWLAPAEAEPAGDRGRG